MKRSAIPAKSNRASETQQQILQTKSMNKPRQLKNMSCPHSAGIALRFIPAYGPTQAVKPGTR